MYCLTVFHFDFTNKNCQNYLVVEKIREIEKLQILIAFFYYF